MAVNSISRTDAAAIIPVETHPSIIQGAVAQSAALTLFKQLPVMGTNVREIPVLDSLLSAYFVNGDTGMKQTDKIKWAKKSIIAEEVAVIVPIANSVLDDAAYDIWGQVAPRLMEGFGKVIDGAILFGAGKPASWPQGIVTQAAAAGNAVTVTTDTYIDIFGEGGVFSLVEDDGYDVNGVISSVKMKAKLRGLRDDVGRPLYSADIVKDGAGIYMLGGEPLYYAKNGAWDDAQSIMIAGDITQAVYAIRQDLTIDVFTTGVIQDPNDNSIVYNLMQQDMMAIRAVMRLGWQIPNPINALQPTAANRCPFAILKTA